MRTRTSNGHARSSNRTCGRFVLDSPSASPLLLQERVAVLPQVTVLGDQPIVQVAGVGAVAPEVCEYPDSGKVMAFGKGVRHVTRAADTVDYWEGEA